MVRLLEINERSRDFVNGAVDTYLSMVCNHMNDVNEDLDYQHNFIHVPLISDWFLWDELLPGSNSPASMAQKTDVWTGHSWYAYRPGKYVFMDAVSGLDVN